MYLKAQKTAKHLKKFGIDVCEDCGHYKSIDNSICYNCNTLRKQAIEVKSFEKAKDRK